MITPPARALLDSPEWRHVLLYISLKHDYIFDLYQDGDELAEIMVKGVAMLQDKFSSLPPHIPPETVLQDVMVAMVKFAAREGRETQKNEGEKR